MIVMEKPDAMNGIGLHLSLKRYQNLAFTPTL
jgi:hypothetical protein